jgi:acyl carrier protein
MLMLHENPVADRLMDLVRPAAPGLAQVQGDVTKADLRDAGLTSIAAVRLMLEIEAAFGIAIPDSDLTPENFANIGSIEQLVERLQSASA